MQASVQELPPFLEEFLKFRGIAELNPPQSEALPYLLETNRYNLIVAIPTGSGKTLVAEIAILDTILNKKKKAIYLSPLIALAREKYEDFLSYKEKYKIEVAIRTGEYESDERDLSKYDLVSLTFEKMDSLSRHSPEWMKDVGVVIVDEAHSVTDKERGATLECLLTRLHTRYPVRLILLSAVMPNVKDFANWLGAKYILSDWRAVPLKKGVFAWSRQLTHVCGSQAKRMTVKCQSKGCGRSLLGRIRFTDDTERTIHAQNVDNAMGALVLDIIKESGQCLIFARGRKETTKQAKSIGTMLASSLSEKEKLDLAKFVLEAEISLRDKSVYDSDIPLLLETMRNGAAFHHAGMDKALRRLVEDGFRNFLLKVVAATPTLAMGVNLPARRVVIQQITRYNRFTGPEEIERWATENMLGRAGRRAYDKYGEGVLLGEEDEHLSTTFLSTDDLKETQNAKLMTYLKRPVENIESKLFTLNGIASHMLAEICSGPSEGVNLDYVDSFFKSSFGAKSGQIAIETMDKVILQCYNFLLTNDLISKSPNGNCYATTLGLRLNQTYINPLSIMNIKHGLKEANGRFMLGKSLISFGWLHLTCASFDFTMRPIDDDLLEFEWEDLFLSSEAEWFSRGLQGASVLQDYIDETSDAVISERYKIGKGDIATMRETGLWLLGSIRSLSTVMGYQNLNPFLTMTLNRLEKGITEELLDICALKGIGRQRGRSLFQAGIKTRKDLLNPSNFDAAARVIGEGNLKQILNEAGVVNVQLTRSFVGPNTSLDAFSEGHSP